MEKESLDLMMANLETELGEVIKDLSNLQILGPRNDYKTQKGRDAEFRIKGIIKRIKIFREAQQKQAQY